MLDFSNIIISDPVAGPNAQGWATDGWHTPEILAFVDQDLTVHYSDRFAAICNLDAVPQSVGIEQLVEPDMLPT